eukprot:5347792-Lingulodinium_polyedra.AAC.1
MAPRVHLLTLPVANAPPWPPPQQSHARAPNAPPSMTHRRCASSPLGGCRRGRGSGVRLGAFAGS